MNWNILNDHITGTFGKVILNEKVRIAAFDMDDTLIKDKDVRFSNNWIFFDDSIPEKIKNLSKDHTIIIVTNQNGIGNGKTNKDEWMNKVEQVAKKLNIPFMILVSINKDKWRKPCPMLWDKYITCDMSNSFFCGDAAGLPKRKINGNIINKDFSDTDFKFALNLGIRFIHRDEFVYNEKPKIPIKYPINFNEIKINKYPDFVPNAQELIIMVGFPGSGKSYYSTNKIVPHNYKYVNQDTLKTQAKCLKACEKELKEGNSVVIDNTNSTSKTRKTYIDIAQKYNVKCKCIIFNTLIDVAKHNNCFRSYISDAKRVPDIAYNMYKSKYEQPNEKEGFYNITNMDFVLDLEGDVLKKYKMYYY